MTLTPESAGHPERPGQRLAEHARHRERFATATSPDYWFGLSFDTREQRDEFLALRKALDRLEVRWVNGRKPAARPGLKSPRLPRRSFKIDPKLADLSL